MTREFVRHIAVALVAICLASVLVAGVHVGPTATRQAGTESGLQASGPDPGLQVVVDRHNITTNNSTSFVTYVGNPRDNDRPMHLAVRIRVRVADRNLRVIVGRDPGIRFDDHFIWTFPVDLDPGEYWLVYGSVGRHSDPGTYPIEVSASYLHDDGIVSRSSVQEVRIEPERVEPLSWWEQALDILAAAVVWVLALLTDSQVRLLLGVLAAIATILAFVVELLGRERFLAALGRPFGRERDGTDEGESDDSR